LGQGSQREKTHAASAEKEKIKRKSEVKGDLHLEEKDHLTGNNFLA